MRRGTVWWIPAAIFFFQGLRLRARVEFAAVGNREVVGPLLLLSLAFDHATLPWYRRRRRSNAYRILAQAAENA